MTDTAPRIVVDTTCDTGEGPLWHPEQRCLYWVDIPAAKLFRHDSRTGAMRVFDTGSPVGGFTLHEDGRLLLFMAEGAVRLWHDGDMQTVIDALPEEKGNRFNDVIAGPEGHVFCGVMSTPQRDGRLYRLDPDGSIHMVLEGTGVSNGMGFSPDLKRMYFCDSGEKKIFAFDYDRATGNLANRTVLVAPDGSEGVPDGLTVDAEGCIWSARWGGGCIVRHDPAGRVMRQIDFPARLVSCVTFGGPDYADMYVTTAGGGDRSSNGPAAGALFHLRPGPRGRAEFRSRMTGAA